MTTFCPRRSDMYCPESRAMMSGALPGGNVTTRVIGRVG